MLRLFSFLNRLTEQKRPRQFSLGKRGRRGIPGAREDVVAGARVERPPAKPRATDEGKRRRFWSSIRQDERKTAPSAEAMEPEFSTPFSGMPPRERELLMQDLSPALDANLRAVRAVFHSPRNESLIVREFKITAEGGPLSAAILDLAGMVDAESVRRHILTPLMAGLNLARSAVTIQAVVDTCVTQVQTFQVAKLGHVVASVVEEKTVVLIDGQTEALVCDTRSPEHRSITESPTEAVVRGPHTGFVENFRANMALVRGYLQTPDLVAEYHFVGGRSHTPVAIMYVEGVVNPKLVEEVRKRISSVRMDYVGPISILTQVIQDHPNDPFPTFITTERPDKVAAMLVEGHVALLNDTPGVTLVPAVVWSLMHSSEDYYIHFIPASAIRILRWLALFITVYASAAYVAIVTFHPAMIPTQLLFAMASSREVVPFPAALEVLAMELAFELIREAGVRIPAVVGPTIGIVGAVVLGQAAVAAGIVSPILVVVVSLSGLGSFAIPNYHLSFYARIAKFVMIVASALMGIPGLTLASLVIGTHIVSLRSFGVPVTAPLVPNWPHSTDLVVRTNLGDMAERPQSTRPIDSRRRLPNAGVQGPEPPAPLGSRGGDG